MAHHCGGTLLLDKIVDLVQLSLVSFPGTNALFFAALSSADSELRMFGSGIMPAVAKNVIHISEAEAASDSASVMAQVRAGAEIVIDRLGLRSRRGRNHQEPRTVGSASVGVILDSGVIIAAERTGRTVRQILEQMTAPGTTESR
jgi:hypothetical protein